METKRPRITRTISKTPSTLQLRWPVSENCPPAEARSSLQTIIMLKTLIIATVLLPRLTIAQQSQQLLQPRQPGQAVGWMASSSYCIPGSDKAAVESGSLMKSVG